MDLSASNISPKPFLLVEALIEADSFFYKEHLFAQKIFGEPTLNVYIL